MSETGALGPREWRCFHCDSFFQDEAAAALHFGISEYDKPACQFDIEHIRWMEAQHRRSVDDDTEVLRTVSGLAGEHEALRRRAEEQGYAKGLADAKKHPEELGLVVAPPATPSEQPAASQGEAGLSDDDIDRLIDSDEVHTASEWKGSQLDLHKLVRAVEKRTRMAVSTGAGGEKPAAQLVETRPGHFSLQLLDNTIPNGAKLYYRPSASSEVKS